MEFELEAGHTAVFSEADEVLRPSCPPEDPSGRSVQDKAEPEESNAPNCLAAYTFDNFIVGEENRYAYSAALTASQEPGKFNPLYIYGSTGMGKTHLM